VRGYPEDVAWALHHLALALALTGRRDDDRVAAMLRESVLTHARLGDRWRTCSVLETIAGSLLVAREPECAAQLLAAAAAERHRLGTPVPPAEMPALTAATAAAASRLSPETADTARVLGEAMHLDAAVALAVERIDERFERTAAGPGTTEMPVLSDRELDVLRLVCAGRTNREIGGELFISPSTAGVHVSNILRKLGARSRAEAASAAARAGLVRLDDSHRILDELGDRP
jgi:DNA-binding NarL/FixJ family response regulator